MYGSFGWLWLHEGPDEDDPPRQRLVGAMSEIRQFVAPLNELTTARVDVVNLNGEGFMTIAVFANRRGYEATVIDQLLQHVLRELPATFGILYEYDDERPDESRANSFEVRVVRRGAVHDEADPYLSPMIPTVWD